MRQELRQAIATRTQPDHDWFVIAIPIVLYHQLDRDFEIVEGEFSYQGKVYEKAMQRIQNDTLYVYCVNNFKQEKVRADLSDHLKSHIADCSGSTHKKSESQLKSFLKSYYLSQGAFVFRWLADASSPSFGKPVLSETIYQSPEVYTPPPQVGIS